MNVGKEKSPEGQESFDESEKLEVMHENNSLSTKAPPKEKQLKITAITENLRHVSDKDVERNQKEESDAEEKRITEKDQRHREMLEGWNRADNRSNMSYKSYQGVIHRTQELSNDQSANLRTREEIRVSNIVIPQNTLLSGSSRIAQGRVMIEVSSVRLRNDIYPVSISVYGSDGQPGLPTSMSTMDNAINKEVTDEAISQVGRTGDRKSVV